MAGISDGAKLILKLFETVEAVKIHKDRLIKLASHCRDLLSTVEEHSQSFVGTEASAEADEIERVIEKLLDQATGWSELSYPRAFIKSSAIKNGIENCYRDLAACSNKFMVALAMVQMKKNQVQEETRQGDQQQMIDMIANVREEVRLIISRAPQSRETIPQTQVMEPDVQPQSRETPQTQGMEPDVQPSSSPRPESELAAESHQPPPGNTSAENRRIVLASRASQLAKVQTNIVLNTLKAAFPDRTFDTSFMSTQGDKDLSRALYLLGGKSLWTKELEVALLAGEVDMLVHSLKDVPTAMPEGCALGAILEREHSEDSLVVKKGYTVGGRTVLSLDDLPAGAVIGTSSVRRVAQLRRRYPYLVFKDVRGNLQTRFDKLDNPDGLYDAIILAKAGLLRQGFADRVTADILPPTLFHAVGQGALAVEIRSDDEEARRLCSALTHWQTSWRCLAERACLRVLEGGCSVPVGVHTELMPVTPSEVDVARAARLWLVGTITAVDGRRHVEREIERVVTSEEQAEELGAQVAKKLIETGGREILEQVAKDREQQRAVGT